MNQSILKLIKCSDLLLSVKSPVVKMASWCIITRSLIRSNNNSWSSMGRKRKK